MDRLQILNNIAFLVLYIIFFSTVFNRKVEFLIMICICIITILGGFNIIQELYYSKDEKYLNLELLYDVIKRSILGKIAVQSVISVIFIIFVCLYVYNKISLSYLLISTILMGLSTSLQINTIVSIPIWALVSIPIILVFISLIFTLIKMNNWINSTDNRGKNIPVSKHDRKKLNAYKGLLIADICLIITVISGNVLPITYKKDWFTILEYILFTFIYTLSPYLVYFSNTM
jgi:hypothetical protein